MRVSSKTVLTLVAIVTILSLAILAWMGFSFYKYGYLTRQACQQEWWEDQATCAAQLALDKNNPKYCRIDHFGETGDLCALLFAEKTIDVRTCKHIDLLEARKKCEDRFSE